MLSGSRKEVFKEMKIEVEVPSTEYEVSSVSFMGYFIFRFRTWQPRR